jgi:hypothetical protein
MSYSTSSEEGERHQVIIPIAIVAQAKEAIEKWFPKNQDYYTESER